MSVCSRERIFFFWGVSCFCDSEKDLEQALFCVMAHDSAARSDPTCGKRFSAFEEGGQAAFATTDRAVLRISVLVLRGWKRVGLGVQTCTRVCGGEGSGGGKEGAGAGKAAISENPCGAPPHFSRR